MVGIGCVDRGLANARISRYDLVGRVVVTRRALWRRGRRPSVLGRDQHACPCDTRNGDWARELRRGGSQSHDDTLLPQQRVSCGSTGIRRVGSCTDNRRRTFRDGQRRPGVGGFASSERIRTEVCGGVTRRTVAIATPRRIGGIGTHPRRSGARPCGVHPCDFGKPRHLNRRVELCPRMDVARFALTRFGRTCQTRRVVRRTTIVGRGDGATDRLRTRVQRAVGVPSSDITSATTTDSTLAQRSTSDGIGRQTRATSSTCARFGKRCGTSRRSGRHVRQTRGNVRTFERTRTGSVDGGRRIDVLRQAHTRSTRRCLLCLLGIGGTFFLPFISNPGTHTHTHASHTHHTCMFNCGYDTGST